MASTTPAPDPSVDAARKETDTVPADASAISTVALRDIAVAVALLSVWAGADAWYLASGVGLGAVLSAIGGLLVGAAVTALAHEWGHFAGARLSGGTAPVSPAKGFVPLFMFDFERSREEHFRAMSMGGNLAHWFVALAWFALLPGDSPGQIAVQCGGIGFAVFASTIEFPVIRRAFAGVPGKEALGGIGQDTLRRSAWIGLASALVLFALL
ncbi:MAG: hypothetical protein GY937_13900 [bacterium]|nr:hypothetical protein [bacterium]